MGIFSVQGLISLLISIPALILAIGLHEFAHAFAATKLGDNTPKSQGRLTLNPFKHIDIIGFISLALVGIGWGKSVETNIRNFKKPFRDFMLVALAGPAMNFIIAFIFCGIYKLWQVFNLEAMIGGSAGTILLAMLVSVIQYNILLGVFNLLPIPPLDGSRVLLYLLPYNKRHIYDTIEKYSFIIILIIFITNLTSIIVLPVASFILNLMMSFYSLF